MEIITRKEAQEKGLPRYFIGEPCKRGHVCQRLVCNNVCIQCKNNNYKRYYQRHKEKMLQRAKEYRTQPDIREKRAEYCKEWHQKNKERARRYAYQNRQRYAAHCNKRRTVRLRARPSWVDSKAMDDVYKKSRETTHNTGIKHNVDHYYPLMNELVCGLDVPWNLQIITASENRSKGNKMPEEFYGPNHQMKGLN